MVLLVDAKYSAASIIKKAKKIGLSHYIVLDWRAYVRSKWDFLKNTEDFNLLDASRMLDDAVNDLRPVFLDYVRDLGKDKTEEIHLSRIAEQNPFVSTLFINICKVEVCRRITIEQDKNVVIISTDIFLLTTIALMLKKNKKDYLYKGKLPYLLYLFKDIAYYIAGLAYFIITSAKRELYVLITGISIGKFEPNNSSEDVKNILFNSYFDYESLGNDCRVNDRYYGILPGWLEERGYKSYYLPNLYNVKKPLFDVYRWLRNSKSSVIIPEDYYRFCDYARAVLTSIKLLFIPGGIKEFMEMDISHLLLHERLVNAASSMSVYMYRDLPRRLKQSGFDFLSLIDTFEGMVQEKALLIGMKKAYPGAFCVGYQHSFIPRNLLCYFTFNKDDQDGLLPDRIVCTGPFTRDILSNVVPDDKLGVGCALRYPHLWGESLNEKYGPVGARPSNILVTVPLERELAGVFMGKIVRVANALRNKTFLIKPHPMYNSAMLKELVSGCSTGNFRVVGGSMGEALGQAGVLVTTASATAVEAMAAGVPVVIIGNEMMLNINPLDWYDSDYAINYYNVDSIAGRILDLLNLSGEERYRLQQLGRSILEQCFLPVSEEALEMFLKGGADA